MLIMERKAREYDRTYQYWSQKEDTLGMRCMDLLRDKGVDRVTALDRALAYDAHAELRQIGEVRQHYEGLAQNMATDLAEARYLMQFKIQPGSKFSLGHDGVAGQCIRMRRLTHTLHPAPHSLNPTP